ncbi:KEOPS complex subunit Pcc1 [Halocalculus aciditolerans]|uniref:Rpo operon protein n=1 Tax=Halocalculus aciditolerans TaxID=1383812 RepID=A0A830FMK7_9EURY|nr:KEOPS complex subunit Pcc1 [Halocalculus aciditolerans]GGL70634.1 hypothetical protein GCM10009039_30870 [Halocalculus aciditolerans]
MARHGTDFVFSYDSPDTARVVERSVRVEAGDIEGDRTSVTVERTGATVAIDVEAADLTALRAGHNTWTSLVEVAERAARHGSR